MSEAVQALLMEIEAESVATRKVLEAAPQEKFDWKPHEKSMSLGTLTGHIAKDFGMMAEMFELDSVDFGKMEYVPFVPATQEELLAKYDESLATVKSLLGAYDDAKAFSTWSMMMGEQSIFSMPRIAAARMMLCNHIYHHRGQMSVYLRLLDVPVPSVYGPTADDNPFA